MSFLGLAFTVRSEFEADASHAFTLCLRATYGSNLWLEPLFLEELALNAESWV